jgi:uncharacterized FlaG/YvyC family protein
MSFELPPLSGADKVLGAQPVQRTESRQPTGQAAGADVVQVDTIPSQPPTELRAEMDRAAKRVDELKAEGRELHFARDQETGRVVVQVRDLSGNVLRTIPPSKALAVASGAGLD